MEEIKRRYLIGIFLFTISFGVYLKTLCPTVYWGDSGELITVCYTLGIAHPAGYPLYTLLGRIFTLLPIGSIAYRVNLMSALFASLTVVLIYLIVLKLTIDHTTIRPYDHKTEVPSPLTSHIPAIVASLLFALSPCFWAQATIAEVYILHTFFIALLILTLLNWKEKRKKGYLYSFALLFGLSLGSHITSLLFAPAFIIFILLVNYRQAIKLKNVCFMLGFFLLGSLIYFYLPIRSLQNPILDWGNPENWKNFLNHVTCRQFAHRVFNLSLSKFPREMGRYATLLIRQFTPFFWWLGIIGMWYTVKKNYRDFTLLALVFLINIFFMVGFTIPPTPFSAIRDAPYFLLPSLLVFSLWLGLGAAKIMAWPSLSKAKPLFVYFVSFLLILAPFFMGFEHYRDSDRSHHCLARNYGLNILNSLEREAVLFPLVTDTVSTWWYLRYVENKRPDTILIHQVGLRIPQYRQQLKALYPHLKMPSEREIAKYRDRILKEKRPSSEVEDGIIKYLLFQMGRAHPLYYELGYFDKLLSPYLIPNGLVYKVEGKKVESLSEEFLEHQHRLWKIYEQQTMNDRYFPLDAIARHLYANIHHELGIYYGRREMWDEAESEFKKAIEIRPNDKAAHINLGIVYQTQSDWDGAVREFEKAIKIDPRAIEAHYNLGILYTRRGLADRAGREWREVLRLAREFLKEEPGNTIYQNMLTTAEKQLER